MNGISLARNIPKSAALVEFEDGAYFFMIIIAAVIVLGIVFYPAQIQSIFSGLFTSFFAPASAFIHGLIGFFWSLIQNILNMAWNGIQGGAKSLYNNTIGRL